MGSLEFDAAVGLDEASGDRVSPALAASPHPSAVECVDAIDPVFKGVVSIQFPWDSAPNTFDEIHF